MDTEELSIFGIETILRSNVLQYGPQSLVQVSFLFTLSSRKVYKYIQT